jgi:hypothetical protein
MSRRAGRITGWLALAVGLAACVDPAALASTAASPPAVTSTGPSQAVPSRPDGLPSPSASASGPAATPATSDLEALLPQFAGPNADYLDKRTLSPADLRATGQDDATGRLFERVFADLGVAGESVEAAFAGGSGLGFLALRIRGVSPAEALDAFERQAVRDPAGGTASTLTAGGHEVRWVVWSDEDLPRAYFLVFGDVLVIATAAADDEAIALDTLATMFEPKLELVLPAELDGQILARYSMPAAAVSKGGDICGVVCPDEMPNLAAALGVALTDIDLAAAYTDTPPGVLILAIRVPGVDPARLIAGRIEASGHSDEPWVIPTELTAGGKRVTWVDYSLLGDPSSQEYLYVHGDVLFSIRPAPVTAGPPGSLAEAAIAALP